MLIYLPWLISLLGLLIYLATENPKISNVGDRMFWTGLLAALLTTATQTVSLGR